MTTLTRFMNQNTIKAVEVVIDTATGAAYVTQTGYARISRLSQTHIDTRCKNYHSQDEFKKAEVNLGYGSPMFNLIPANLVCRWLMSDNPELGLEMGKAGPNIYLHHEAGYRIHHPELKEDFNTVYPWLATELSERYSSNTLATGKGRDNTSYQHTKWQESIVEVLRGLM